MTEPDRLNREAVDHIPNALAETFLQQQICILNRLTMHDGVTLHAFSASVPTALAMYKI